MLISHLNAQMRNKAARENRKITLRVIGEDTGISIATLSRWGRAKLECVDVPTWNALCLYFECRGEELLELKPEKAEPK